MMHKWKDELQTLTFRRKEDVKKNIRKKRTTSYHMPLLYVSFTAVALACIALSFISPSATSTVQATTLAWYLSKEELIYAASSQLLLMVSYGFFVATAHTQRRKHRFSQFFKSWQGNFIGTTILLTCMALIWTANGLFHSDYITHGLFGSILFLTYISVTQFLIRKRVRQHCPHCQTTFTHREIMKTSFRLKAIRCLHCHEKIYINPKENQLSFVHTLSFPFFALLVRMIDLNVWVITILFIAMIIYLFCAFMPYSVEYIEAEDNDLPPPLW